MALSSTDVFVQFICYYHILNNFYESVYNEAICKSVQHIIQDPGFSAKRNKDIVKIIDTIGKKIQHNRENFQGNELEALELTIRKFIEIDDLSQEVQEFDSQ